MTNMIAQAAAMYAGIASLGLVLCLAGAAGPLTKGATIGGCIGFILSFFIWLAVR